MTNCTCRPYFFFHITYFFHILYINHFLVNNVMWCTYNDFVWHIYFENDERGILNMYCSFPCLLQNPYSASYCISSEMLPSVGLPVPLVFKGVLQKAFDNFLLHVYWSASAVSLYWIAWPGIAGTESSPAHVSMETYSRPSPHSSECTVLKAVCDFA